MYFLDKNEFFSPKNSFFFLTKMSFFNRNLIFFYRNEISFVKMSIFLTKISCFSTKISNFSKKRTCVFKKNSSTKFGDVPAINIFNFLHHIQDLPLPLLKWPISNQNEKTFQQNSDKIRKNYCKIYRKHKSNIASSVTGSFFFVSCVCLVSLRFI